MSFLQKDGNLKTNISIALTLQCIPPNTCLKSKFRKSLEIEIWQCSYCDNIVAKIMIQCEI